MKTLGKKTKSEVSLMFSLILPIDSQLSQVKGRSGFNARFTKTSLESSVECEMVICGSWSNCSNCFLRNSSKKSTAVCRL